MSTLVWRPNKKVITTTVSISRKRPSNDSCLLGEHYKKNLAPSDWQKRAADKCPNSRLYLRPHLAMVRTPLLYPTMMTSSNGNIFRVTGPLCGEFNGYRWIPLKKPVTRSVDVFCLCLNKRLSKQSWGWWFETQSRPWWRHNNVWGNITTKSHSIRLTETSCPTVGFIFVHVWRWWEPRYYVQLPKLLIVANEVSLVNTYSDTPAVLRLSHCDRHIFRNSGNWPSVSAALRGCVVRPVRGSHQLLPLA